MAVMAGIVKGSLQVDRNGEYGVQPDMCAVEDQHRLDVPLCFRTYPDGETRVCPFWIATTRAGNYCARSHPSALAQEAKALSARVIRLQIVCSAARRNRPAGV